LKIKYYLSSRFGQARYIFKDEGAIKIKSGWILRLCDEDLNIDIDISINKKAEFLNSMLILEYVLCDERFKKLAQVLKI